MAKVTIINYPLSANTLALLYSPLTPGWQMLEILTASAATAGRIVGYTGDYGREPPNSQPQQTNLRIVNVLDSAMIGDYLNSPDSDQVFVDKILSRCCRNG